MLYKMIKENAIKPNEIKPESLLANIHVSIRYQKMMKKDTQKIGGIATNFHVYPKGKVNGTMIINN